MFLTKPDRNFITDYHRLDLLHKMYYLAIKKCICNFLLKILPLVMNVTVGQDKPLARLNVVCRLSVDKGQVLWAGILDTSFSLHVLPLENGLTQELKIYWANNLVIGFPTYSVLW